MKQLQAFADKALVSRADRFLKAQEGRVGYAIAWLLGVPLPILLVIYLIRGH